MKKTFKIASLLLAVALILCSVPFFATAATTNYLIMGDSIARGAGVLNSGMACYGRIVADTNGYAYNNEGVDGITAGALILLMQSESYKDSIRRADIISLSIGGNDFLTSNMALLAAEALVGNYSQFDSIASNFYSDFSKIISTIRRLNPRATLLVQTLYNPQNGILHNVCQQGVDRLNSCYRRYLNEHPGAYTIVDVGSVMNGHRDYIAIDTIHPNDKGNVAIAKYLLRVLKNMGLGTKTEPVINEPGVNAVGFGFDYWAKLVNFIINQTGRTIAVL